MTPEQLHRAALAGERIEAPQVGALVPASLQRIKHPTGADVFALWGITGKHFLSVVNTDAARLHSHWQGFVSIATATAKGQR